MQLKALTLFLALLLGSGNAIFATLIDSFDVGGSSISTTGPKRDFTETNLDPMAVLPGTRTILITASQSGQTVTANANSSIPGALALNAPAGISTTFGVEYRPTAHFNMQVPGTNYLMVNFDSISTTATLNVWLRTVANTAEDRVTQILSPSTTSYLFAASSFPNVNFADVESLRVSVTTTNGGAFTITQISTVPEASPIYFCLAAIISISVWRLGRFLLPSSKSATVSRPLA